MLQHLCGGRYTGRVDRGDLAHILDDGAELVTEALDFLLVKLKLREFGNPPDIFGAEPVRHSALHRTTQPDSCRDYTAGMTRASGRRAAGWSAAVVAGVLVAGAAPSPDPPRDALRAQPFTLVALDLAGRRHPVRQFDGRRWQPVASVPAAPEDDTRGAIVGLEASAAGIVHEVSAEPGGSPGADRALAAVEAAALSGWVHAPAQPRLEATFYRAPNLDPAIYFVDVIALAPGTGTDGVAASAWVWTGAERPVAEGLRLQRVGAAALERRRPIGVAVPGTGGGPVWVMYTRRTNRNAFELVEVRRPRRSAAPWSAAPAADALLHLRELDLEEQR